ncbi:hypothetical protein [Longimicrobium sp.]|uniref:hypothetical protein n=1 Tax=Longimicrobium sp. TaxID=2029185 RepID=UPI002CAE0329|nr:hypothetical protein [Longimicrobium sp.]HSU16529.1 hypothetical protein [Longimicrobium sp.]
MKKLRLELEGLRVDTFQTAPADPDGKSVDAYEAVGTYGTTDICYCAYPSTSCANGETGSGSTCYCMYPKSGEQVCCSDIQRGCSAAGSMC